MVGGGPIKLNKWVGGLGWGGWLDQVGIRLSQLSTKLKLKLKLSLAKSIFHEVVILVGL